MDNKPILSLDRIRKTYHQGQTEIVVLNDASLNILPGEIVGLVGASGSGKTTFLNIAGLLDTPNTGQIHIKGHNIPYQDDVLRTKMRRQHLGFVYQFHYLLGELTALENVMMPLLIQKKSRKFASERAQKLLTDVGLIHRENHLPSMLSGGEQQRVAIARALSTSPSILLADEPTGNLDTETSSKVFEEIVTLVRAENMGALVVTHDPNLMQKMDRVLIFKDGQLKNMAT